MYLQNSRQRIEERYEQLTGRLPGIFGEVEAKLSGCDQETALAVKYLYCTMPYSDMGNYPFEIFEAYAGHGVRLWRESEEVRKLPEEIYLNYVLYHRINEEEIDFCRDIFYEQLKDKIHGMNGKEAALEVNYWCVQEATYQCTDDRTLSALSVYRRGNGRCGEESTFSVNAMRSVGIPARQIYAPRWSHCDDNHAWVEVWCDGVWYFTGACEPVPILNKGWFTNASSRAMIVHSRWFDFIPSKEELIGRSGMVSMLNETKRYAATGKITVTVTEEDGTAVPGAKTVFEVLNYAQFFPVAECVTDENGQVTLNTGLGSLHIHVYKDGICRDCFIDTRDVHCMQITLKEQKTEEDWKPYDIVAPVDTPVNTDMPTPEQKETGDKRLEEATKLRQKKVENWVNPEREKFLNEEKNDRRIREELLSVLTEKDQTDCRCSILEEHLEMARFWEKDFTREIYVRYVLNPRVDDEVLSSYRKMIIETFSEEEKVDFQKEPVQIWSWIDRNIVSCPDKERDSLITTPAAALKLGVASHLSKEILFVAIARTIGIPARLNPEDRSMEYWKEDRFVSVLPNTRKNSRLYLKDRDGTVWTYAQNWSIAKREEENYTTLRLAEKPWKDGQMELELEEGSYRILTANRLPNGNQFLNQYEFVIEDKETKEIELKLRQADLADMLENISLPGFCLHKEDGKAAASEELTDQGKHIFLWLEESKEPTEHILNELMERQDEFAKYADSLLFVVRSSKALQDPTVSKAVKAFPDAKIYYDDFKENVNVLGRRMYVDHEKLPLIIVTSRKQNGIYATSGYNVGTGDMLLRLLKM